MEEAIQKLIDRVRAEGQLTRNTGTNSIKSVMQVLVSVEKQMIIQSSFLESMYDIMVDQNDFLRAAHNETMASRLEEIEDKKRKKDKETENREEPVGDQPSIPDTSDTEEKTNRFSLMFLGIGNAIGALLPALGGVLGLVKAGGLVAAGVGLMYTVFGDIGNNPVFQSAMESVSNMWNNGVVPLFNRLADIFSNIISNNDPESWQAEFMLGLSNIKDGIQTMFGSVVGGIAEAILSITSGIAQMLDGDIWGGLWTMLSGMFGAITDTINGLVTGVLQMFGVNFGNGSTVNEALGNFFSDLSSSVIDWASDASENIGNWFSTSITGVRQSIRNARDNVARNISEFQDATANFFRPITEPISNGLSRAYASLIDTFTFDTSNMNLASLQPIAMAGVNASINFVMGIFSWGNPEEPFVLQDYTTNKINQAISYATEIFDWTADAGSSLYDIAMGGIQQARDYVAGLFSWRSPTFNNLVAIASSGIEGTLNTLRDIFAWSMPEFPSLNDLATSGINQASDFVARIFNWQGLEMPSLMNVTEGGIREATGWISSLFSWRQPEESTRLTNVASMGVDNAMNWAENLFDWTTPNEDFRLLDMLNSNVEEAIGWVMSAWNSEYSRMQNMFSVFMSWLAGIPERIWVQAQITFTDLNAKLRIGFTQFAEWFSSLPDRIMAMVIRTVRSIRGGSLIFSEDDQVAADRTVTERGAALQDRISTIESERDARLQVLQERAAELNQQMTNVVTNSGNTNVGPTTNTNNNTTIINNTSPSHILDPAIPGVR